MSQQDELKPLSADAGDEEPPLVFFAAYIPDGEKKRYLGNGQGGIRLVKDEQILSDYLKEKLPPEEFEKVIIHPVTGLIAVPESILEPAAYDPRDFQPLTGIPITTLYPPTVPTAGELLTEKTGRKRHKPKGAR